MLFEPYDERAHTAPAPVLQVPIIPPLPARDRLSTVVREIVAAGPASTDSVTARIVDAVLAELCPANHLLITAEVVEDHDPGMNTPSGYEPPYSTAMLVDLTIVHDTVESDATASLLMFAAEIGETVPDGTSDLDSQIIHRFEPQRQAVITKEAERRREHRTMLFPLDLVSPDTTDRSQS